MPRSLQHEIGKATPFDSAQEEAMLNVLRTASALSGPLDQLFKRVGLSGATYNVLRILRGHELRHAQAHAKVTPGTETEPLDPGVPSTTIGRQMLTRVPDVTRLVDRLINLGLVERCKDRRDKRVVMVRITPAGLKLLASLDRPVREQTTRMLGHISTQDLAELSRLLVLARQTTEPISGQPVDAATEVTPKEPTAEAGGRSRRSS